ncbi:hypothetical protein [Photobacterium lutimaris]|uniref:hypothetical protein n=1 Tax=Photobacterium lutimaris TaxID=388278 RepID=UPI001FD00D45|nr:hypothetical protein [Photobacterium lutimaris]
MRWLPHQRKSLMQRSAGLISSLSKMFARIGMGCTGPIVLVAKDDLEQAKNQLVEADYIS